MHRYLFELCEYVLGLVKQGKVMEKLSFLMAFSVPGCFILLKMYLLGYCHRSINLLVIHLPGQIDSPSTPCCFKPKTPKMFNFGVSFLVSLIIYLLSYFTNNRKEFSKLKLAKCLQWSLSRNVQWVLHDQYFISFLSLVFMQDPPHMAGQASSQILNTIIFE